MTKTTILLVDDQLSGLIVLEDILASLPDCSLIKATSAKQAMLIMMEQEVDCVLLDVSMPEMDGFDFLMTLHHAPAHANIPVIMVTGKVFSENEKLRAYQNGAVDFLIKPLDSQVVYRKVSFFVQQAKRMKSLTHIEELLNQLPQSVISPLEDIYHKLEDKEQLLAKNIICHLTNLESYWREMKSNKSLEDLKHDV